MTCIFYMNADHTMSTLTLYVEEISKTKLQKKEKITTTKI